MDIDHIFIFVSEQGRVADELVSHGLREGSRRVHPGQGTSNRKFYFENFFLEILWASNQKELSSESIRKTGLWQRSHFGPEVSPFGLCITNTEESTGLFSGAVPYQPDYFPAGKAIDVLKNEHNPCLPWTFRLPFQGKSKNHEEPLQEACGIHSLTCAEFGISNFDPSDPYIAPFEGLTQIKFTRTAENRLTLTFDEHAQGRLLKVEKLRMEIRY